MIRKSKSKKTRKPKSTSFTSQIQALEKCLSQDYESLGKVYPKLITEIDKVIIQATKELTKAKQKSKTVQGAKVGRSTKVKSTGVEAIEKELRNLIADRAELSEANKKHLALKKELQRFEKAWSKKPKTNAKPRIRVKKLRSAKKSASVEILESTPGEMNLI
jgi:hypothetical protein